jgi:hypothetical protein
MPWRSTRSQTDKQLTRLYRDLKHTEAPAEADKPVRRQIPAWNEMSSRQRYLLLSVLAAGVCSIALLLYWSGLFSAHPRAPSLSDDPVFQSKSEGFRFVAPPGWSMRSRAEVPPGTSQQERLLVEYKRLTGDKPASLEVSLIDRPEGAPLTAALKTRQPPDGELVRQTPLEEFTVEGVPAVRIALQVRVDKEKMVSEVVAVRRGERVYFFTGFYPADDNRAKEQVRGVVDSIVWLRR